jgi:hypothetical protein
MSDLETAVRETLRNADAALEEYDEGYADADATVRRLRRYLDELRAGVDE